MSETKNAKCYDVCMLMFSIQAIISPDEAFLKMTRIRKKIKKILRYANKI